MIRYAVRTESAVEADVEAAFDWYEGEEPGLGFEFLAELRAVYERIVDQPFGYQDIRSGIRRVSTTQESRAPNAKHVPSHEAFAHDRFDKRSCTAAR